MSFLDFFLGPKVPEPISFTDTEADEAYENAGCLDSSPYEGPRIIFVNPSENQGNQEQEEE